MTRSARHEPIDIHIKRSAALTPSELDEIWAVTDRYVETERAVYEKKLAALPEVGLWRTRGGRLVGLVSLDVTRFAHEGRRSIIIFTSSVVVDEPFRRRHLVLRTGVQLLLREKLKRPWLPAYWLFDTFSYKSYVIMPRNLRDFWPRHDRPTPATVTRFIDALARHRYGESWNPATGVVQRSGQKRLRESTAPIDDQQRADVDVRFYEERNPGHRQGDMLVCIAPLSAANLLAAVKTAFSHRREVRARARNVLRLTMEHRISDLAGSGSTGRFATSDGASVKDE